MKITFACPYCGKKLSVSDTSAGKQKTCPNCRGRVTVPTAEAAARTAATGETKPRTVDDHPLLFMPRRVQHKDLIDMTAMVDIVFFLLIFFLVTSMQSIEAVINLPAPQAPASAADTVQAVPDLANDTTSILVTIDDDDAIWVEDEKPSASRTCARSSARRNKRTTARACSSNAAPESTHGTFVSVLDAGADAGMTEIQFSVPHAKDSSKAG